jgi:hypothetical protein
MPQPLRATVVGIDDWTLEVSSGWRPWRYIDFGIRTSLADR